MRKDNWCEYIVIELDFSSNAVNQYSPWKISDRSKKLQMK